MLDKIVESCRFLLKDFPEAQACRDYIDSRLSRESQELFQFGWFPDNNNLSVLLDLVDEKDLSIGQNKKLIWSSTIEDAMGIRNINKSYFRDNPLVFPYRNVYGQVVALVGRSLLSNEDRDKENETRIEEKKITKYKNTPESSKFKKGNLLYGLYENKQHILDQNCVYVVEGQFDVIKAVEKGLRNIVALGTSSMTPYQFSVISRYTNNIILLLDNDEAGERGRKSISSKFGKYANIQNFYLPESHKDIDEYLTHNGTEPMSFIVKV